MADGKTDRTVGDIGEFALIERLVSDTPTSPAIEVGPGDDAAVIGLSDGRVVACVDVLVEGTHFRRDWSNAIDVGRRIAAASLSDINAMGAQCSSLLVGLVAPGDLGHLPRRATELRGDLGPGLSLERLHQAAAAMWSPIAEATSWTQPAVGVTFPDSARER